MTTKKTTTKSTRRRKTAESDDTSDGTPLPTAATESASTKPPRRTRKPASGARRGRAAAAAASEAPVAAPAGPAIEQTDRGMVIRFPAASPPSRGAAKASAAEPPAAPPPINVRPPAPPPDAVQAPAVTAARDLRDDGPAGAPAVGSALPAEELTDGRPRGRRGRRRGRRGRGRKGLEGDRSSLAAPTPERPPSPGERPAPQPQPSAPGEFTQDTLDEWDPSDLDEVLDRGDAEVVLEDRGEPGEEVVLDDESSEAPRLAAPAEAAPGVEAAELEEVRGRGRRRRRGRHGRRERPEIESHSDADDAEIMEREERRDRQRERGPTAPRRREMVINIVPYEECRIAILENGRLEEIYIERASNENHVFNIYKGVVTNVEPSIQAAFVNFGLGKNGFLHISDLHPRYFPKGEERTENVGRKTPRRARPPIQNCLRKGQEIIVQITKEGIGTKGPTLTSYLSIPGRFLVLLPDMREVGVSRKIEDDDVRRKIRQQLDQLELPGDMGFIARTAAEDRSAQELQNDLNYLTRLWRAVEKRMKQSRAPAELYRDSDLVIRTIRDVFTDDIQKIVVDDAEVADRAREFLSIFSPNAADIVTLYDAATPVFHQHGIEAELERLHSRHVPLKSGGSLVIDQTEALVAIDVNSGRFRAEDDAETTAFRMNMEAADEIPRQLRLRDLGGVIICDFIDMRVESHRREVERRLVQNLKAHKERAKVLRMSRFGMIEMTRQRQRASLTRTMYQDCAHCRGTGLVKSAESVALDVMRLIQLAVSREHIRSIEITVSSEVAYLLQNRKRSALVELEKRFDRVIAIKSDPKYGLDQHSIQCLDARNRVVPHT